MGGVDGSERKKDLCLVSFIETSTQRRRKKEERKKRLNQTEWFEAKLNPY